MEQGSALPLVRCRQRAMKRHGAKCVAFAEPHVAVTGLAQTHRICQHGVEHRLKLAWRTGDDAQHLGRGGLLLQGFAQLVEQTSVLDGDDGLRGEIRDQLDLLVGERAHLLAVDDRSPISSSSLSIGTRRRCDCRLDEPTLPGSRSHRSVGIVGNVNAPFVAHNATEQAIGLGVAGPRRRAIRQVPAACRASATRWKTSPSRGTRMPKLASQSASHSPAWPGTPAASSPGELRDDAATLRRSRSAAPAPRQLARARLHLVEQPHVLDRDHGLVGEGLHQLDLLVGERPHLGATHRKHANGLFFPKQWDREDGAVAYASCGAFRKLVASSREVVHMDSFAVHGGPSSSPCLW